MEKKLIRDVYSDNLDAFYVFNKNTFIDNIASFKRALSDKFENYAIGYSFKTNSLPYVIKIARESGCYAEVVSDTEYSLALEMGFERDNIIFNGPIKGKETFINALYSKSIVNMDSKREVEWLLQEASASKNHFKIGIRVNFDLESEMPSHTITGESGGRFGFSYELGELQRIIDAVNSCQNISIVGLHMHVSTKTKSKNIYETLSKKACELCKEYNLDLDYLDLGGGFFGGNDGGFAYVQYVDSIYKVVKEYGMEKCTIIVEPGASVVATAFDYVTTVIDVKDTYANRIVVTNGTRLHIDPFFRREKYDYELRVSNKKLSRKQIVCGYSCMENDRIMCITDKELSVGDQIIYHTVGSYTVCFNSLFIEPMPAVYCGNDSSNLVCIRKKWSVEQIIFGSELR